LLLFSCGDDDEKIRANLPELAVEPVIITGDLQPMRFAMTLTIDNDAFIGLGRVSHSACDHNFYRYDPENCTWKREGVEFPGGYREDAVAFVIGNKAYVGLGADLITFGESLWYDDFWVYDHERRVWSSLSFKFPGEARRGAVAFSIGGKGYVGTGITKEGKCLADFYEFDPEIGWTKIRNIDNPRYGANAFVADGYGYVCFGNLFGGNEGNSDVQRFDPFTKTWRTRPVCYDEDEMGKINKTSGVASFVLNKNGQDFVYVWGGNKEPEDPYCWGFNPRENV